MNASTLPRHAFMPRPEPGMGLGAFLALLAHGLLVAALAFGVSWRTHEPEVVQAELWAALPTQAAPPAAEVAPPIEPTPVVPPAAEPPPPPKAAPEPQAEVPDAAIAREQAKKEARARRDQQRREAQLAREQETKQKELAAKREEAKQREIEKKQVAAEQKLEKRRAEQERLQKLKADEKQLAEQRDANLKRLLSQAGGGAGEPGSSGTAAQTAAPSAGYAGRINGRIRPNIVFTEVLSNNPVAEVELRLAPDGRIVSQKLISSSGVKAWDDAVLRAIERTEVLPRDIDGRVPSPIVIAFRPRD